MRNAGITIAASLSLFVAAAVHMLSRPAAASSVPRTTSSRSIASRALEDLTVIVLGPDKKDIAPAARRLEVPAAQIIPASFDAPLPPDTRTSEMRILNFYKEFGDFRPEKAQHLQALMGKLGVQSDHAFIIAGVEGLWRNGRCTEPGQSAFGLFQFTEGSWIGYLGELKQSDPQFLKRAFATAPQLEPLLDSIERDANGYWHLKKSDTGDKKRDAKIDRAHAKKIEDARKNGLISEIVGIHALEMDARAIETATGRPATSWAVWLCHILGPERSVDFLSSAQNPYAHLADLKNANGKPLFRAPEIRANGLFRNAPNVAGLLQSLQEKTYVASAWQLAAAQPAEPYLAELRKREKKHAEEIAAIKPSLRSSRKSTASRQARPS